MEPVETKSIVQYEKFVVFELNNEQYGANILQVREIIRLLPITRVPKTPEFIEGIINLRGTIIPVIDLKKRLGMPATPPDKQHRILILDLQKYLVGFMIDKVSEVISIPRENIHEPPDSIHIIDNSFIEGIAQLDERLIIIINFQKILEKVNQEEIEDLNFD